MDSNSKEKIKVLDKEIEVIEAKVEQRKVDGKVEEKMIHAWSILAIKVGAIILAIAVVIVILVKR